MSQDFVEEEGRGIRDPEELEAEGPPRGVEISPRTTLGPVHLTVADLARSVSYYEAAVGLEVIGRSKGSASVGAGGRALIVLVEEPGAAPAFGHTGLYHVALLLPERADLARWLAHATRDRVPLVGMSDHFVSEALYLTDPDGHGLEIYRDRSREHWEGKVAARMTTLPLDAEDLLGVLPDPPSGDFDGMAAGAIVGHVHLKVKAIPEAVSFYRDILGFGLMAELGSQAAFLSAGGYHHHIGANTWGSAAAPPPPPGSAALRHLTVVLPDAAERDTVLDRLAAAGHSPAAVGEAPAVRDPSGNLVVLDVP